MMKTVFKLLFIANIVVISTVMVGCSENSAKSTLAKKGYTFDNNSLLLAIDNGDIEAVRLFVEARIDLNPKNIQTPLHRAVVKRQNEIIDFLLKNGAAANNPDNYDYEPLDFAIVYCDEDLVKKLVAAGADINKRSKTGVTPLAKAKYNAINTSYKCHKLVRFLSGIGAKCELPAQPNSTNIISCD